MARNDVVLLDSLVDKAKAQLSNAQDIGELFELFCIDQILKDYDLSYDEIEDGWVGGGDDAGIDGMYTFVDSRLITSDDLIDIAKRNPLVEVYIISAKHADSFEQSPFEKLMSTLPALFDLRTSTGKLPFPVNDDLLECLGLFRKTYIGLADKHPKLGIKVIYGCRGDAQKLQMNITERGSYLEHELSQFFSDATVEVKYLGASELLKLARRTKIYSLRLKFIENSISRGRTNYVVLSLLTDYYQFITDEEGNLRRYLFESNVRDYLGGQINKDINETLSSKRSPERLDFWWLNNGITLLASSATIAGKELSLENVQIVNGLQTTQTIFNYFNGQEDLNDKRGLLIKIIVTDNPEVRDKIIKATNYQNPVELASLRATDKLHRDIEHYLADHGWFYDRRKGFHKNQGRPAERIVAMSYLGAAVRAIVLRDPVSAIERKTRWMRKDESYREVFNESYGLGLYLACLEIFKTSESLLRTALPGVALSRGQRKQLAPLISLMYTCMKIKKRRYGPNEVARLEGIVPTKEDIIRLCKIIESECKDEKTIFRKLRMAPFTDVVLKQVISG